MMNGTMARCIDMKRLHYYTITIEGKKKIVLKNKFLQTYPIKVIFFSECSIMQMPLEN